MNYDDDEESLINFTFDGEHQLGPLRVHRVRTSVAQLRRHVERFASGGPLPPLEEALHTMFAKVQTALTQFEHGAAHFPDQAEFFAQNINCYSAALLALEQVDQAIDNPDDLLPALARFEAVIARIETLLVDQENVVRREQTVAGS